MKTAVAMINANSKKIDGVKVSLLDKQREIDMRRRLDSNVKMYTGDDFNYAELIAGDDHGHSDALLGAFAAVPRFTSAAFAKLGAWVPELFGSSAKFVKGKGGYRIAAADLERDLEESAATRRTGTTNETAPVRTRQNAVPRSGWLRIGKPNQPSRRTAWNIEVSSFTRSARLSTW